MEHEECPFGDGAIHYDLDTGVVRITGQGGRVPAALLTGLLQHNSAHGQAPCLSTEEREVVVYLPEGGQARFPAGKASICMLCGTVLRRECADKHTCELQSWHRAIVSHVNNIVGGIPGSVVRSKQGHAWCMRSIDDSSCSNTAPSPSPGPTLAEIEMATQMMQTRADRWRRLADAGWHDDTVNRAGSEEVLLLRSEEICLFPSLADMFIGTAETVQVHEQAPHKECVLYAHTLAGDLQPSARRTSSEEAEGQFGVFIENFDLYKLGGKAKAQEVRADSSKSYGKHSITVAALQVAEPHTAGYFSYGQYENLHTERMRKEGVTEKTRKYLNQLALPCLTSLSVIPRAMVFRPRLQHLRNCRTRMHTDRERGDTFAFVRWDTRDDSPAALLFDTHIMFRTTLYAWHGSLMVPIATVSGDHASIRCVAWSQAGGALQVLLRRESCETADWKEVGRLDVVVGGLRAGDVVCTPRLDMSSVADMEWSMREATTGPGYVLTAEEAMEMAARNGRRLQPPRRYVCVGWDKQWVGFRGWAIPHMLVGDPTLRRVHVYSRVVEEHPTCATASRVEYVLDIDSAATDLSEIGLELVGGDLRGDPSSWQLPSPPPSPPEDQNEQNAV